MLMETEKRKSVSWNSYRRGSCTGVFSRSVMSHSAAPWTVDCQNPLPMKSSRQEYWSGVPFPTPEDLPNPGIKPVSPALQVDSLPLRHWGGPFFPHISP